MAVYEEASVSAAARRCHVSQPSVSEALASLESELAVRLFVRHRKGATPTAEGERLYPVARTLVEGAKALPALFKEAPRRRSLTIGLMKSLDVARTKKLLAVAAHDPELALRIVDAEEPCDVRVVSRAMRGETESFASLWHERYVVAMAKDHPLAAKANVRGTDLVGARLVARCHCETAAHLAPTLGKLDVVAVAASEEWAVALVAAGVGIAFLPEGVVPRAAGVVTRPISAVNAKREVGLAYGGAGARRKNAAPSVEVQRFVAAALALY